jgi:electron transport complex protein RnfC
LADQPFGRDQLPDWIERLRTLGFWADRRGAPHLMAQLHHILRQPADTLLCSLLDDEPSLCLNSILAAHAADDLLSGLEFLGRLMEARHIVLVVEAGVPGKWWNALRKRARKAHIIVVPLINDYPQSDPTLLIYAVLKRRLSPALLPVEQRVVLLDGAAAVALGQCVVHAQPMLSVPIAIRDHLHHQSHFFDVPVGTPLEYLLKEIGCLTWDVTLLRGDLLHDNAVKPQHIIAGGELIVHVTPPLQRRVPDPCVRCCWCFESCPTRVAVANLLDAAQRHDFAAAERFGIGACIECGVCSYVCPSHLPLLGAIRTLKQEMTEAKS